MKKLFLMAFQAIALTAFICLLAVNPHGNAQGNRPAGQAEPGKTDADKEVSGLIAALKDRSYWVNQCRAAAALGRLGAAGKGGVPALITALKDPKDEVRMAAARALKDVGTISPEVVVALNAAAKEEDIFVRYVMRESCMGLVDGASKNDVAALFTALKDFEPILRQSVVRAMGEVGSVSPESLAVLKDAEKDADSDVRFSAQKALEKIRKRLAANATKNDVPVLMGVLKDPKPFISRDIAARALGDVGSLSPEALTVLKNAEKDGDPDVRLAAKEACERIRNRLVAKPTKDDVPVLIVVLMEPKPFVRRDAAARALGSVGSYSPEALAALKAALKDDDHNVRLAVKEACEKLLLRVAQIDVVTLFVALKDSEPIVRRAAARALREVRSFSPEALVALRGALKDDDQDVRLGVRIATKNLFLKATKDDVPALIVALRDSEPIVRGVAARALGTVESISPNAFAALKAALKDEDQEVLLAVKESRRRIRERLMDKATQEDEPILIAVLNDPEPFKRRHALIRALGKVGSVSSDVMALLKAAAKDNDSAVRSAAIDASINLVRKASGDDVMGLVVYLKDSDSFIRQAAARGLGRINSIPSKAFAPLTAALRDEDQEVRLAASETRESISERLVAKATQDDVPDLIAILKDTKSFIRRDTAVRMLGKVGSYSPEALAALKAALKDGDQDVRLAVKEACENLMDNANNDDLAELVGALRDSEPIVRQAAARALGKASISFNSPEALTALKNSTNDSDPEVRRAANEALEGIPKRLILQLPAILEHERGSIKRFDLKVYRHRVEGPVSVKFEGLPKGVLIPEVKIAADQDAARFEVMVAKEVPPGSHLEIQVMATTGAIQRESRALIYLDRSITLAEAYLHLDRLAEGEAVLAERLKNAPHDDQARFGLGVLRFVHGVERLGQSLHKFGVKSNNTNIPFLRLPVPTNPDPAPINYLVFRHVLDKCYRDLSAAVATLAGVTDDKVKLPLRLANIRLDFVGAGKPTDKLLDVLRKIMLRRQFDFEKENPEFLVCFDRGDVAWLRAYCHLLMGMVDFYLAFDTEKLFDISADELFARPEKPFSGNAGEKLEKIRGFSTVIRVAEPARLGQFRKHLVKVAALNRETWKHIRAETDDDHEWLPNPRQTGVFRMPVQDRMIDSWLAMMAELEALLEGSRSFGIPFLAFQKEGKGLNLKALLDDPPREFVMDGFPQNLPDKYWCDAREVDWNVVMGMLQFFENPTDAVFYAAWFN